MRKLGGTAGAVFVIAALVGLATPAVAVTTATTTTLVADAANSVSGETITFTATVASSGGGTTPTGTVTFDDGGTELGTATLAQGKAPFPTGALPVGDHTVTASYGGDADHSASHGSKAVHVDKAPTLLTVNVTSPPTSARFAWALALAPVPPGAGTPTGSLIFTEGDKIIGSQPLDGSAPPALSVKPGLHHIAVTYGGDDNFLPTSAVLVDGIIGPGYRLVAADGGVFSFGSAPFFGSLGGTSLNAPVIGGATTSNSGGYWMLGRDGGVFTFGDAPFFGAGPPDSVGIAPSFAGYATVDGAGDAFASNGGAPIVVPSAGGSRRVGIASGRRGTWTAAADGGVFSVEAAPFFGSMGGVALKAPIVGIAATPTGDGYWLVASDGGVFAFGDAGFFGSTGALRLNKPVVGMAPTPTGNGYWLVASDGGVFSFGDAAFEGSTGDRPLNQPIVAILPA